MKDKVMDALQRFSKAMFIPVLILPIAGILIAVGNLFTNVRLQAVLPFLNNPVTIGFGTLLSGSLNAILGNRTSRELVRNTNPATGMYEPYRPQQMSADGPDDPSPRRSIRCPACSHTFAQDCGRIGVPSRSRGACAPISRIMMLCMCARRRSTRPSTSRPKAN